MTKALWQGLAIASLIFAGVLIVINIMQYNKVQQYEECKAEATAWYMSSTALSDAIVMAALKGFPAEKVDTNVAVAFAIKGHELQCIEPKLPTG
jgi:predicted Co/Zn/Cd cation transporter (cation efflux family)